MSVVGLLIVEQDRYVQVPIVAWSFPGATESHQKIAIGRSQVLWEQVTDATERCGEFAVYPKVVTTKFGAEWQYFALAQRQKRDEAGDIVKVAMVVIARDLHREKYGSLLLGLFNEYLGCGFKTTTIVKPFLTALSFDRITTPIEWDASKFDQDFLSNGSMVQLAKIFSGQAVDLWTAMLLRKRIIVYCPNDIDLLLQIIFTLPQLVWHRQDWSMLRPMVAMTKFECKELINAGIFCAGVTEDSLRSSVSLYDVFVNVPEREVFVLGDHIAMNPLREDICEIFERVADTEEVPEDQKLVKLITKKNTSMVSKITKLGDAEGILNHDELDDDTKQFLIELGKAEHLF